MQTEYGEAPVAAMTAAGSVFLDGSSAVFASSAGTSHMPEPGRPRREPQLRLTFSISGRVPMSGVIRRRAQKNNRSTPYAPAQKRHALRTKVVACKKPPRASLANPGSFHRAPDVWKSMKGPDPVSVPSCEWSPKDKLRPDPVPPYYPDPMLPAIVRSVVVKSTGDSSPVRPGNVLRVVHGPDSSRLNLAPSTSLMMVTKIPNGPWDMEGKEMIQGFWVYNWHTIQETAENLWQSSALQMSRALGKNQVFLSSHMCKVSASSVDRVYRATYGFETTMCSLNNVTNMQDFSQDLEEQGILTVVGSINVSKIPPIYVQNAADRVHVLQVFSLVFLMIHHVFCSGISISYACFYFLDHACRSCQVDHYLNVIQFRFFVFLSIFCFRLDHWKLLRSGMHTKIL